MKFEVGDSVRSEALGEGNVSSITGRLRKYPVEVEFSNNMIHYFTADGGYMAGTPDPLFDIVKVEAL